MTVYRSLAAAAQPAFEAMLAHCDEAAQQVLAPSRRILTGVELDPVTLMAAVVLAVVDDDGVYRVVAKIAASNPETVN